MGFSRAAAGASRAEMLRAVQVYQVGRMRLTHAALFRSPAYGPLCEFFLSDLYGPREMSSRATSLQSLASLMRPILPGWIYDGSIGLIEIHALSETLDDRLARSLADWRAPLPLSPVDFEAAFLRCDDRADRLRQIELSAACTAFGHALSGHASVGRLLGAAHALHGFQRLDALLAMLERGFRAFRGAGEIGPFIEAMRTGETAYLDGIYSKRGA